MRASLRSKSDALTVQVERGSAAAGGHERATATRVEGAAWSPPLLGSARQRVLRQGRGAGAAGGHQRAGNRTTWEGSGVNVDVEQRRV